MSLYAWLMLGSFAGPFALSFDKKVAYYKQWPALFAGIFVNGIIFILWDGWFSKTGIWGFSEIYTMPYRINHLPLEEWSFFVVIPYASVFIYACLKAYINKQPFGSSMHKITLIFFLITAILAIVFNNKTYTLVNCGVAAVLLIINYYLKPAYMGYFWLAYFIHLIPFLLVNGVLTGAVTPEPVVWYNNNEIIGLRILTIPVEDTIYALTCLLLPINIMEWLNKLKKA
ncbi:MAG: lycopene cyclase domain-containing protein [Bacteroidia bacterium]